MITLPSYLSEDATIWLEEFTGLDVSNPTSSINVIWPFVTIRSNLDEVAFERVNEVLLTIDHLSHYQQSTITRLKAIINSGKEIYTKSLKGEKKFFALEPNGFNLISLIFDDNSNTHKYLSIDKERLDVDISSKLTVDIVFTNNKNDIKVVSLHIADAEELTSNLLEMGYRFTYISMPKGVEGKVRVYSPGSAEFPLLEGIEPSPHNPHALLLNAEANDFVCNLFYEKKASLEFDFGGFGNLFIRNLRDDENDKSRDETLSLPASLRNRLMAFLTQLSSVNVNNFLTDEELVGVFECIEPKVNLVPHYRSIKKDILDNGNGLKRGDNSI